MSERADHGLGPGIRRCRMRADLTMGDLARALNVPVPTISDIERGVGAPPSREMVASILRVLGTHVDESLQLAAHHALNGPRCFSDCYPKVGGELAVRRLGRLIAAMKDAIAASEVLLASAYRLPPGPLADGYRPGGAILVPMDKVIDFRKAVDGLRDALAPEKNP